MEGVRGALARRARWPARKLLAWFGRRQPPA
jgi:hypothetical protein